MTAVSVSEDPRTDPELLRAHVDGDHDAFGVLFARHRDRLWAVALRTMGNPEDAADGLQDGMISAYRRAGILPRGGAGHHLAAPRRRQRLPGPDAGRQGTPHRTPARGPRGVRRPRLAVGGLAPAEDPADVSVRDERRGQVLAALGTLPAEQRAALVLVDMEGYSVAEAAAILECAVGTVKSRCSRGRARLAGLLEHLLTDVGDESRPPPGTADAVPPVPSEKAPRAPPTAASRPPTPRLTITDRTRRAIPCPSRSAS